MRHRIKVCLIKAFLTIVGHFPARSKMILFESFQGKQYSCNPKAIYTYMQENHPEYKMYWAVDRNFSKNFEGHALKTVERFSIKWLFVLGFSKYWVVNSRMPATITKPRHTTYVQTWHGTPLKKLVFDMQDVHMPNTNTDRYKQNFYKESRQWDILLSPNRYSTEKFKSAFRFEKSIVECGYPRNDVLHLKNDKATIEQLKAKLNLPSDKKIILYAPTWRDNQFHKVGAYKFDLPFDPAQLQERFGSDCVVLLRMHYLIAENFDLAAYDGFIYDVSQKCDINELYLVSDLLITDYSSVFFDYANLRRPILFYMYDIETYRDTLRGFYFSIEQEAPGPIVKNEAGLLEALETFCAEGAYRCSEEKYQKFYDTYCYLEDGHASKRFVESVLMGGKLK